MHLMSQTPPRSPHNTSSPASIPNLGSPSEPPLISRSSSKLPTKSLTRPLTRLSSILSFFLLLSPTSILHADAVSCISPTPATTVQVGQVVPIAWQLSTLDSLVYNTIYAELYCQDASGLGPYSVNPYGYLVSQVGALQTSGDMEFVFPNCGASAVTGSIKVTASSSTFQIETSSECHFSIQQLTLAIPLSSVPQSSTTTQTSTSTTASPAPRVAPPVSVTTSTLSVSPATPTTTQNPANSSPSSSIGATASGTSNTVSNSPSSNAGGDTVPLMTFTAYAPTVYPTATTPYLVPGSGLPPGVDSEPHHGSSKSVLAVLSSLGVIVCVTLVIMPLVIRHRRRKAAARASRTVLPRSIDSAGGIGGGAGAVMKESKSIFRISRQPKGGYFYKMEDEDDDQVEICTGEGSDKNTKLTTSSNETHPVTVTVQGSGIKEEILERAAHPPLATPQQVHLEPSPMLHVPGALSPFENSSTREYTMSSTGSNFENSSVIRRYWEASMAARAECNTSQPQTQIGHEEGSIFSDDNSRDSESRMADILSLRSSGSGSITETLGTMERYNRRSTLGGMSSFGNETSLTTTISSVPDSLLISEEEFLERLQMHQLEQEYYNQYYPDHHDQYTARSFISRSSSIPSLTSTNDPFKTFDSNEILLDVDPFSDSRAVSRASQRSDQSL